MKAITVVMNTTDLNSSGFKAWKKVMNFFQVLFSLLLKSVVFITAGIAFTFITKILPSGLPNKRDIEMFL